MGMPEFVAKMQHWFILLFVDMPNLIPRKRSHRKKKSYEHGISVRTVRRGLKELMEYNIIIAEQVRQRGQFMNYIYTLLDKSEWKKITEGQKRPMVDRRTKTVGRLTAYGVEPTKDNKQQRITNIKDNKDTTTEVETSESQEINQCITDTIQAFKETVNPTINFGNKTNRQAVKDLLKLGKGDYSKLKELVDYAISVQGKSFSPTITTPYQLREKLGALRIYNQKEDNNKVKFVGL